MKKIYLQKISSKLLKQKSIRKKHSVSDINSCLATVDTTMNLCSVVQKSLTNLKIGYKNDAR